MGRRIDNPPFNTPLNGVQVLTFRSWITDYLASLGFEIDAACVAIANTLATALTRQIDSFLENNCHNVVKVNR